MHAIKHRAVGFYKWLRETQHVEKASRRERIKRDVWMVFSFVVSVFVSSLVVASVGGTAMSMLPNGGPAWLSYVSLVATFVFALVVDSVYVFPWGVRRFDITIPWQFREAEYGGE